MIHKRNPRKATPIITPAEAWAAKITAPVVGTVVPPNAMLNADV